MLNPPVFLFTFALFLSGYIVQQRTVARLRIAIKPRLPPTHTDLYTPPVPGSVAFPSAAENNGPQTIEINTSSPGNEDGSTVFRTQPQTGASERERDEQLERGKGEDFLKSVQRQQEAVQLVLSQDRPVIGSILEEAMRRLQFKGRKGGKTTKHGNGGAGEAAGQELSRAARRKAIKDEIERLQPKDPVRDSRWNYKRRSWLD